MLKTNISAGTNRELNYKHFFLSSNSFIEGFPSITKKKKSINLNIFDCQR